MFHRPKQEDTEQNTTPAEGSTMSNQNTNASDNNDSTGIPASGFSRLGMNRPNMPGNYSGYNGGPSFSPAGSTQQSDNGRKLIVGQGISMSGEIDSCDHLIVEGKVEAALRGARLLDITENGTFFGTVEIDEANISGTFEGDLTVKGRLSVHAGGSITGEISYGELAIEAGAIIEGSMRPLNTQARDKKVAPKVSTSTKTHAQQQQKVAQDMPKGGQLNFADERKVAAAE